MRLTLGLVLAVATTAVAQLDSFHVRREKYEERSRIARQNFLADSAVAESAAVSKPKHKFLTAKTKKFAVNGKGLPLINFDIGESYSGLLPIDSTGRELFFWFFPAQGKPSKDVTIWLNGGPGCSSLEGLFEENGPFVWQPGTYGPRKNPYALNKLSNVVYVEQPVGAGYSQGKHNTTNEIEVAKQFDGFWKNFMDTFDLHDFGIYITGESYAGQYVPYIGNQFLLAGGKKYHDLKGIMIYDPVIGPDYPTVAAAVPFAEYNSPSFPFSAKIWQQLRKLHKSCGFEKFMEEALTFPPKKHLTYPTKLSQECDVYDSIYNEIFELNPCFNIYHVSETCPAASDILGGPAGGGGPSIPVLRQAYFNRTDVKKALHAPVNSNWAECKNVGLRPDGSPPSAAHKNGPVAHIAEKTGNVIVGHAKNDYILLSNASLIVLNNLEWNGKQGFDAPPNKPLIVPQRFSNPKSTEYVPIGSWTKSRGITFVEIELSGHMVPQYNPRADFRIQEVLHGRVKSLDAEVPFTGA